MVTLEQMRASNARIPEVLPAGLVAVFVGGTSGIGETTMKQFAKHAVQPRIYFVGRSDRAAARITGELTALNPAGQYCFIRADVSLLRNVDDVSREIKSRETLINLLFLTPGTATTGKDTPEALYYPTAVTYYARVRLIVNLLPLLQRAPVLRRVVTVFGGTKEGPLCTADLSGRSLSTTVTPTVTTSWAGTALTASTKPPSPAAARLHLRAHLASMMTLALESLAFEAPDVSFVHSFPGLVRNRNPTKHHNHSHSHNHLGRDVRGVLKAVFRVVGGGPGATAVPLAEAGERQLFLATSARFPARSVVGYGLTLVGVPVGAAAGKVKVKPAKEGGVDQSASVAVARGSDARVGSGVYSVACDGEAQAEEVEEAVQQLRDEDLVRRLWVHTVGEFVRVTGSEFV